MKHVLYALFDNAAAADAALLDLTETGIQRDRCTFHVHRDRLNDDLHHSETDAQGGLFGGLLLGGVAGAVLGSLFAGPMELLQIGAAAAAFCGAGAGSLYGAVGGVLSGSGMPDRRLRRLGDRLHKGQVLITAEIEGLETEDRVGRIFRQHGAQGEVKALIY